MNLWIDLKGILYKFPLDNWASSTYNTTHKLCSELLFQSWTVFRIFLGSLILLTFSFLYDTVTLFYGPNRMRFLHTLFSLSFSIFRSSVLPFESVVARHHKNLPFSTLSMVHLSLSACLKDCIFPLNALMGMWKSQSFLWWIQGIFNSSHQNRSMAIKVALRFTFPFFYIIIFKSHGGFLLIP